jgi:hypothetical protein
VTAVLLQAEGLLGASLGEGAAVPGSMQGCAGMKAKVRQGRVEEGETSANELVRREIQSFLRALDSYPERFSTNPGISFEQHRSSLVEATESAPRGRRLNGR